MIRSRTLIHSLSCRMSSVANSSSIKDVHYSSAKGFSGADSTKRYHNVRPTYPDAALKLVAERIVQSYEARQFVGENDQGVALSKAYRPIRILDLGCGTGISAVALGRFLHTHLSESYEFELYAADPGESMVAKYAEVLEKLGETDPELRACMHPAVLSTADALPFPRNYFDAVVCGQSLHWFDTQREITAVSQHIAPGGCLIWMWNEFSKDCKWADDFHEEHVQPRRRATNTPHQTTGKWRVAVDIPQFTPELAETVVPGVEALLTVEDIIQRYASASVINILSESEQQAIYDSMTARMAKEPVDGQKDGENAYKIWYDTQLYWKVKKQQ